MNFSHNRPLWSKLVVFVSVFTLLTSQTMFVFAATGSRAAVGEITVSGVAKKGEKAFVLVNGDPAFSGRTFISGGTITTEANSATVDLGKIGRLILAPGTSLTLAVSGTNISGTLASGDVDVSYGDGIEVMITTPNDLVRNEHTTAGSFAVGVAAEGTEVIAGKGVVRYNNGLTLAGTQDDDDDDHDHDDWTWIAVVVGGAAVAGLITYFVLRDDEVASPVR
jgi:hypothetical protein